MKHYIKIFASLFIFTLIFAACSPEDFALGMKDVKPEDLVEGIAYKIEHDASNPNIIYLTSLMGNKYTPLWNHPQGRSQEQKITLKIPFSGNYEVQFGVETRGGIVWGPVTAFNVKDMYAGFISDPLWTLISGGADNEKTWYLDLDENQISRYFAGPLYFYGTYDSWDQVTNGIKAPEGADSWNWNPDYKGNSWLMNAADFGSMTFSLKGAATVTVNHKTIPARGTEVGKYMLDVENHTMRTQDATILHDIDRDHVVADWGNIKIMSLTENTMQLAVLRDPALSGEGACLLVYNFISKEYKDNWTPGEVVEPEPQLPDNWQSDVSQTVSTTIKWVLSPETPFNWAQLDGTLMNADWTSVSNYPDWTGFNAAVPDTYQKFSLTMNSSNKSVTYTAPDGTATKGTYTLDEKGYYTFTGVTPKFTICSWVELKTSAENQWRITKIEKDAAGNVTGMWVGVRDPAKPEYMVYHLIPQIGGGGAADPLAAWKNALIGKTFTPDIHAFVDWVGFPPDFTGGWTVADTNFGGDNYTANSWIWTQDTRNVCESVTLAFTEESGVIKLTLNQKKEGVDYSAKGDVLIDAAKNILNISIPLVDYAGTPAAWVGTTNEKSVTGNTHDWYFVSHDGATLANIATKGFWLGKVSNSIAAGDTKDEILLFHFVVKP